jgi:hypothetical protein
LLLWAGCVIVGPVVGDVVPPVMVSLSLSLWFPSRSRPVVSPWMLGRGFVGGFCQSPSANSTPNPPREQSLAVVEVGAGVLVVRPPLLLSFASSLSSGPLSCCCLRPRRCPPSWSSCLHCRLRRDDGAVSTRDVIPPFEQWLAGAGRCWGWGWVARPRRSHPLVLVVVAVGAVVAASAALVLSFPPSLPSPSSFVVVPAVSTRNPPCEQLLAAAGVGAGSWSRVPGCWCWCRVPRPLRRGQAAPVIHPTSSCSLAWGGCRVVRCLIFFVEPP